MRRIFSFIIAAWALTIQAQVMTKLASPNNKVVVEIKADKELTYSIIDDGTRLMSGTPNLLLEGKKTSQYSGTATKSAKEHFDAPNYKLTSFDDAYNAVTVKNKNGVNVEFRAYNSGVAYRFVTTST